MVINLALIGVPGEEDAPLITPVNGECLLLLVPTKAKAYAMVTLVLSLLGPS